MRLLAMFGHARSRRGLPALGVAVLVLVAALWVDRHVAAWAMHWKCAPLAGQPPHVRHRLEDLHRADHGARADAQADQVGV
jgi:hypothetical protein